MKADKELNNDLQNLRHTLAHLTAAAVRALWPGSQNAIGPAIENGFYQDFEIAGTVTDADLPKIEAKMRELLPQWNQVKKKQVSKAEALKEFAWNRYKTELIEEFAQGGKKLTFHNTPGFVDLCKGGHVENPAKEISPDAFKLTHVAGAYWRGSEKNKMLTRVYGVAFNTKAELNAHLAMLKEAKKRDHRLLGLRLGLFAISDLVGKGLPLFTPKGALLRQLLTDYSEALRAQKGWQKVWSPHITKNDLYKSSGHCDKFGGELFLVTSQETSDELVMKPMNCPHHQQIYAAAPHSYRELPIKYMETTTVYRDEKAGELLGLSRVRCITQDDSHTFCTPGQIQQIYQELIDVTKTFYEKLGMKIRARLSFRDSRAAEKYLGEAALWEKAQDILLEIAKKNSFDYFVAEGEAAFYGPKIDFMATDALGREWQLATPQLDFVQPKRFGLVYTDAEGKEQTPVMIHFALMGSVERFLSVYIEHTAGAFPLWLSPVQLAMLPISEKHGEYAKQVAEELKREIPGLRLEIDSRSESIGKKIREAALQRVPYMAILGDKEIADKKIALRTRAGKDLGAMAIKKLAALLKSQIADKK